MKITPLLLAAALLGAFAPAARAEEPAAPAKEPTTQQRIYFFEHQLLPKWTHHSQGAFFDDLHSGKTDALRQAATKIVDAAFAEKIAVRNSAIPEGVLISFAPPPEVPDCFFVFIAKTGESFRFYTFEKAEDIMGEGLKACIGGWSEDGSHLNFGFSKEETEEAFLKLVNDLLHTPARPPIATFKPADEPPKPKE